MTSLLTVFVPAGMEGSTFEDHGMVNGSNTVSQYQSRPWRGYWIVDLSPSLFDRMLAGPQGLLWGNENPEALQWRAAGNGRVMTCNAFPGELRGQKVVHTVAEPKMVRLRAPEGVTHYSHDGAEREVGKDGTVNVLDHVADVLKSHGFELA